MGLSLKKRIFNIISRERVNEKGMFLKRIGTLIEEGYSIKDALEFLLKIEKGHAKEWAKEIQKGMLLGNSFHEELEKIGFSSKVCAQIYFATHYGNYGETITRCGDQLLFEVERRKKFNSLLRYPLLLVGFLFGMLLMMRFLILPHMEVLFISIHSNSDMFSSSLIQFIHYSPQIILALIGVFFILFFGLKRSFNKNSIVENFQIIIKQPILRPYVRDYWTAFFFNEWGYLFKSGCSFQEIVTIMKGKDASKILRETGMILSKQMEKGNSINESLTVLPFFHDEALLVVNHGENIGKLSVEMLVYAAYCENELNNRVEKLMEKIQPIVFIFIGLMIVGIYASLMLPIFSIMEGF